MRPVSTWLRVKAMGSNEIIKGTGKERRERRPQGKLTAKHGEQAGRRDSVQYSKSLQNNTKVELILNAAKGQKQYF